MRGVTCEAIGLIFPSATPGIARFGNQACDCANPSMDHLTRELASNRTERHVTSLHRGSESCVCATKVLGKSLRYLHVHVLERVRV